MMTTWLLVAVLGTSQPPAPTAVPPTAEPTPVYKVPGPALKLPCRIPDGAPDVIGLQLWVSDDAGTTWVLADEVTADKKEVEFHAKKPGLYWFAPRLKFKNGQFKPAEVHELKTAQMVFVLAGYEPVGGSRPNRLTDIADELDEELSRLELDLIRKEIKRLAEAKGFDPETADKVDRLRMRLVEIRVKGNRERGIDPLRVTPPPLPEPPTGSDRNVIPLTECPLPTIPKAAPPAAPPPPAPARPS